MASASSKHGQPETHGHATDGEVWPSVWRVQKRKSQNTSCIVPKRARLRPDSASPAQGEEPIDRLCQLILNDERPFSYSEERKYEYKNDIKAFITRYPRILITEIPLKYQAQKGLVDFMDSKYIVHYFLRHDTFFSAKQCATINKLCARVHDNAGTNVIHLLCSRQTGSNGGAADELSYFLNLFPDLAAVKNDPGYLPMHLLLENFKTKSSAQFDAEFNALMKAYPDAATITDARGRLPIHYVVAFPSTRFNYEHVKLLLDSFPESTSVLDPVTKMYPFMLTAADKGGNIDKFVLPIYSAIYYLIRADPARVNSGIFRSQNEIFLEKKCDSLQKENIVLKELLANLKEEKKGLREEGGSRVDERTRKKSKACE